MPFLTWTAVLPLAPAPAPSSGLCDARARLTPSEALLSALKRHRSQHSAPMGGARGPGMGVRTDPRGMAAR